MVSIGLLPLFLLPWCAHSVEPGSKVFLG